MQEQNPAWENYFVFSKTAFATEGHLPASDLRDAIQTHKGSEAFHCAYDLESRLDFKDYAGLMRPALEHVWFDFDSHDGGILAFEHTKQFVAFLGIPDAFVCYSGSKGFHVGVPFSYFKLSVSSNLGKELLNLAHALKKKWATLDTTIYNANRKFRALGTKHPKTGLYKCHVPELRMPLEQIKESAKKRGKLVVPVPIDHGVKLACLEPYYKPPAPPVAPAVALPGKQWKAPSGEAAFKQCGFLEHVKASPKTTTEPQWYAALSVVARFDEGRKQCHGISVGHTGYSVAATNAKVDQALKESAPRTCASIGEVWDCSGCPLKGKINSPVNIFDVKFWDRDAKGKLWPQYNELRDTYDKEFPYKTITDMKTVFTFNGTHYVDTNPLEIKAYAERSFEPKPKEKERQEFTHKVFANNAMRRTFFDQGTKDKINFQNGVFCTVSKTLAPHSPDYGFRNVLPYDYNPSAQAHAFQAWIEDVMLGDACLVAILQEFMGYIIRGGEYKYHKALWLSGTGRNGKSTFLDVLKSLLGPDNYSTLSIRQISNDKFSSADLDGKIANFSEETSPEELADSSQFKNLTGDGDVNAQKKYGDPYKFRSRAKLIMTYNEVPLLKDLSPGMLSRPIIIPWKKDLTLEANQDKGLKERLLTELPGIFNFAFAGWERLEAQGMFTKSEKSTLEMEEIRRSSCTAAQWFAETIQIEEKENAQILKPAQLYEAYALAIGQYAYARPKFFRRINSIPEVAKRRRHSNNGTEYFSMKFRRGGVGNVEY